MSGTVMDAQDAVVPGAEITVTNIGSGVAYKTTTTYKGEWALAAV